MFFLVEEIKPGSYAKEVSTLIQRAISSVLRKNILNKTFILMLNNIKSDAWVPCLESDIHRGIHIIWEKQDNNNYQTWNEKEIKVS